VTDNDEYTAAYSYAADGIRLRAQESNHAHPDRFFLYDGVRPTAEGTLSGDTHSLRSGQALDDDRAVRLGRRQLLLAPRLSRLQ